MYSIFLSIRLLFNELYNDLINLESVFRELYVNVISSYVIVNLRSYLSSELIS